MSVVRRSSVLFLVLAVLLTVLLCSCGETNELLRYDNALAALPSGDAVVKTSLATELGELTAEYTAHTSDGTVSVTFERDTLSPITDKDSGAQLIVREEGSAEIASDGTVTGSLGTLVVSLLLGRIELDTELFTYTESDGILTLSVKADNTLAVFGTDIGYDVTAVITLTDGRISGITLEYTAAGGAAKAECEFN